MSGRDRVDPREVAAAEAAVAAVPKPPLPGTGALVLAFVAGAVVALLGGVVWAVVSIASGYSIGFLAWFIGVAAVLTVRLVARGPVGVFERALVGVFAGVAIILGKYLIFVDALRAAGPGQGVSVGWLDSDVISFFVHHFGENRGLPADRLAVGRSRRRRGFPNLGLGRRHSRAERLNGRQRGGPERRGTIARAIAGEFQKSLAEQLEEIGAQLD